MYSISFTLISHFQLVASWLIVFNKMFSVVTDKENNVVVYLNDLNCTQIECLKTCGASLTLRTVPDNKIVYTVSSGVAISAASEIK